MAISDLTGTKWVLKASLISYPGGTYTLKNYNVNITSDEATTGLNGINTPTDTFALLGIGYDGGAEQNRVWMNTANNVIYAWAAGHDTKSLPDTWGSVLAIPFTITGGSDATNSDLIAWLEDNADQIVPRVEYTTDSVELTSIADAIRAKGATSALLIYPSGFVSAIQAIPTGTTPTGTINISANGTYDVTNYASAAVAIPEYAGAHHSVATGYTVTVSLTNPRNPSYFGSGTVDELLGADPTVSGNVGNQLASFSNAADSAEVTIASGLYGFVVSLSGSWVNPVSGQLICTGGVSGTTDNMGNLIFEVTGNGTATIDNIEWYDD